MLLSPFTEVTDPGRIAQIVRDVAVAQVVTTGADGVPEATLLPILWDGGSRLVAHAAAPNPQFQGLAGPVPVLAIVTGADDYVSPTWYPTKAKRGTAVPTWNYVVVHLTGLLTVHTDQAWLRQAVSDVSDRHEAGRADPWDITQAPAKYIDGLLRGIVGIEIEVTSVQAKAKLSQNRIEEDRLGVAAGLRAEGTARADALAAEMERAERER